MLAELNVTNFAIIEKLHISFAPGLNVLTGETGAGKSIIIDAVSNLLGERADSTVIRSGTDQTRIEGIFLLKGDLQRIITPLLQEYGLEEEDEALILAREINRDGRNVCRVNGRAVTLRLLRQIGQELIDIHGQSEHLSLKRVRQHVDFLDRFADLGELRSRVAAEVKELRQVRRSLKGLFRDERELARREDLLQYQLQEIAAAKLHPGEEEELNGERTVLANAERLTMLADAAYRALYESGGRKKSGLDLLAEAIQALKDLEELDPTLQEQLQAAEEASYRLEDLARNVRSYRDGIEYNPDRLRQVEERLDLIYNLKRKYGDSIAEVLAFAERAAKELDDIAHSEERIAELQEQESQLLVEIGQLAGELSEARHEAGERLSVAIEQELADLNMERASFTVAIEQVEAEDGVGLGGKRYAFDATGIDRVEFLISPNIGEPPKPLSKVASGGETSRLMLAMKSVLSAADYIPTLIFDEIDAGIGGRAGMIVGQKLCNLTPEHQVFCVTHLPQIACCGDAHFRVWKEVVGSRTVTKVQRLGHEERLEELTLMLGPVSEVTRKSALEMLERTQ